MKKNDTLIVRLTITVSKKIDSYNSQQLISSEQSIIATPVELETVIPDVQSKQFAEAITTMARLAKSEKAAAEPAPTKQLTDALEDTGF